MRLRRRNYQSPPRVYRRGRNPLDQPNRNQPVAPEQVQPDQSQPEQNQPEQNQPEQNQPEQNQPEQNQSELNHPEQNEERVEDRRERNLQDELDRLYTDIRSVPSYSAKINDFLRKNHVHSVHRRIVKKTFPRRRIIARFPCDIWMADLIEYPQYKFNNRQYVYILVLIDCFSKKVYAAPMKDKTKQWSVKAFESIFIHLNDFPTHIVTDGGLGL